MFFYLQMNVYNIYGFGQWVETAACPPLPGSAIAGVGERVTNRKQIWRILALKSVVWWQRF